MRKLCLVLLVCLVFSFVFVSLVSGSYVCPSAYYEGSTLGWADLGMTGVHPQSDFDISAVGECFTANSTGYLYNITIDLKKSGSPLVVLKCFFAEVGGGVVGSTAYCGDILDTSVTELSSVDIEGSYSNFTFNFGGTYLIQSGLTYAFWVEVDSGTGIDSAGNQVYVGGYAPDDNAEINRFLFSQSVWGGSALDIYYIINGDSLEYGATPTPSPAVTQNVDQSDPFVAVPSYYMVLLVLFAVVAVLAGLYVTFEREGENKGVALLFVLVGLVLFVIFIVGYLVGF